MNGKGVPMKERTYQIVIDDVTITVTKKRMKHMYLRIKKESGEVLISAPHHVSDARIYQFARERIDWIRTYRDKYAKAAKQRVSRENLDQKEIERRKRLLKREAEALVSRWEPMMQVKVSGITVRQMKTRWGSCNVHTHHINLNLALFDKPRECLEYVVAHEMTHILEPSHNRVFWDYMTKFYPNWRSVRNFLNDETV